MDIPVYLFTGFMDSGKTTFIEETLLENEFGVGARSLIIACEDGEVEYDEEKLAEHRVTLVGCESEEAFTQNFLRDCDAAFRPDQVFIEYNGTWPSATILEMLLPAGWQIVQVLTTVDASTYELYLTNMRTMMTEQVIASDVVIFNRCTDDTPKAKFRRTVKALNRKAQIIYEREDGTIDDNVMEELPYDLSQDFLDISDADYGIFYLDAQENPKKYAGKTIRFLALVYRPEKMENRPVFIAGRFAMTCCVEDIQFIGLKCKYEHADRIPHKSWIYLTAEIRVELAKEYRARGPVLYVKAVEPTTAPEEELVYFT